MSVHFWELAPDDAFWTTAAPAEADPLLSRNRPLLTFFTVHAPPLTDWNVHSWQLLAVFTHWPACLPTVVEAPGISRNLPLFLLTSLYWPVDRVGRAVWARFHRWQAQPVSDHCPAAVPTVVEALGISRYLPLIRLVAVKPPAGFGAMAHSWSRVPLSSHCRTLAPLAVDWFCTPRTLPLATLKILK